MSQEFDNTSLSSEVNDFENQLRSFQPRPAEHAEEIFYQAGWKAAEIAWQGRPSKTSRPLSFLTNAFTRGLVVGMAAALLVAVCLPGAVGFWSAQNEIAKTPQTITTNNEQSIPSDSSKNDDAINNVVKSPADELMPLALKPETISQIFPWNWKPADRPAATFPRTSETSILRNAFDRSWLGLVRTDFAPLTNDTASDDEPRLSRELQLRTSPLDIQRVLDFY